jgi:cell division septation protein DedD
VEETEMALREAGRSEIAHNLQATASPAPASGQQAVERSAGEKALSGANAPAAPTMPAGVGGGVTDQYGNVMSPVKYVGDKTFVLTDGVWTDTTFDPDRMQAVPVSFGSDDYFALVTARPEWGRYLALGDHLVVVLDGKAYEVREGEAPPVEAPTAGPTPVEAPAAGPTPVEAPTAGPTPAAEPTPVAEPTPTPPANVFEAAIQAILDLVQKIVEAFTK